MNDVTTYTRRENARRAGVAAGVPAERIKITVHKSGGKVRFGWREVDPGTSDDTGQVQRRGGAAATPAAKRTEPRPQRQHSARAAPHRPRAGGKCALVWDYLDAHPETQVRELREVAVARGWNVNNAVCELYAWRRYMAATSGQN
jgi:hypothetical protein